VSEQAGELGERSNDTPTLHLKEFRRRADQSDPETPNSSPTRRGNVPPFSFLERARSSFARTARKSSSAPGSYLLEQRIELCIPPQRNAISDNGSVGSGRTLRPELVYQTFKSKSNSQVAATGLVGPGRGGWVGIGVAARCKAVVVG
jgi:hypothetical protein